MKNRFVQRLSCASLLLGLGACAVETGSGTDDQAVADVSTEQLVLAETDIPGGMARFVALDAETVVVLTDTVREINPLRDPTLQGLTIVEAYEYWSGKQAPAELVARAKLLLLPLPAEVQAPIEHETAEGVATTSLAFSKPEFEAQFCHAGVTDYCWTDRTGTWEREHSSRYFQAVLDTVRGDMSIQLRRWEVFGSWTQVWKHDVLQGRLVIASGASEAVFPRPLKFKIFNADGDHWHLALNWF